MFRSHRIAPLAAIVALAFAPSLAAPLAAQEWSGRGRLNGVVSDESGEPIAGAAIRLRHEKIPDSGPDDMKTDKKGRWSKLGLLGGAWTILVAAEGYAPSQGTVTVNEFQPNSPIVLELRKATSADVGDDPKLKEAQAA
ncbi:MAG: carboxypeptidase-like regulatory domain-containing protein, partial [Myxococcota bacterium]